MLRILIVSQYFWPENFRLNELAVELVSRGHHVTVLTGTPNYPSGNVFPEFTHAPDEFARYSGVEIIRMPVLPRGQTKVRLALNYLSFIILGLTFGVWRLRGRKVDVVFTYLISPITAALPALLISKLKRAPILNWILDLWPETLLAVGVVRSSRIVRLVGVIVAFIYRHSDLVLIQSNAFADNVIKYGGDTRRVRYFPGWAETVLEGGQGTSDIAPELLPFDQKFKILFAGNVGHAQDFPTILRAAEILRDRDDIRWIIVGDGRASSYVSEEINKRDLRNVVLLGQFPLERMPSFFAGADALLVTLKKDPIFSLTIPAKIQSYLGAGKPILGMLDGEGARIIEEARAGLTGAPSDAPELARLALRLTNMGADARESMGHHGRKFAQNTFDRSNLISQLEVWMAELLDEP